MIDSPYRVHPGKKLDLSQWSTDDTGPFKDKDEAKVATEKNLEKLSKLQSLLYAEAKHSVLIVLQAMDTGGKDGSIKHVFSGIDPQGCAVTSFKQPSAEEQGHDFLWRIHHAAPRKGMIGIFNRSHYEDVLVVRVHDMVPKSVWSKRYDQINDFERLLAADETTVLKFFLHISEDEQKRRLEKRLEDRKRHWKFDPNDLNERKLWPQYQTAYEDAIRKCSTSHAPWFVVPADHKWYRNWVLSDTIVRAMSRMDLKFPKAAEGLKKIKVS